MRSDARKRLEQQTHTAESDAAYREQAEALIADLRARVSHYESRIADQMEAEVSEDDLRAFIVDVVRRNDSLPQALRKTYRIVTRVFPPGRSVIWEDHERDMQDPEYRKAFEEATRVIPPEVDPS